MFGLFPSGDQVKTKKATPGELPGSGLINSREGIKTRLPRWSAARSQAAGLSFDSREYTNGANGNGQIISPFNGQTFSVSISSVEKANNVAKIDHKLEKWIRWLKIIAGELESLVIAKKVFWTVQGLIKAHPEIPYRQSIFYWHLGNTYIAYALAGIRRQAKFQKDSISLIQLLAEIVQEPTKVSRKYYLDLHAKTKKASLVDKQFDRFAKNLATHIFHQSWCSAT